MQYASKMVSVTKLLWFTRFFLFNHVTLYSKNVNGKIWMSSFHITLQYFPAETIWNGGSQSLTNIAHRKLHLAWTTNQHLNIDFWTHSEKYRQMTNHIRYSIKWLNTKRQIFRWMKRLQMSKHLLSERLAQDWVK